MNQVDWLKKELSDATYSLEVKQQRIDSLKTENTSLKRQNLELLADGDLLQYKLDTWDSFAPKIRRVVECAEHCVTSGALYPGTEEALKGLNDFLEEQMTEPDIDDSISTNKLDRTELMRWAVEESKYLNSVQDELGRFETVTSRREIKSERLNGYYLVVELRNLRDETKTL